MAARTPAQSISQGAIDFGLLHDIVHGDGNTSVPTDSGYRPSIAAMQAQLAANMPADRIVRVVSSEYVNIDAPGATIAGVAMNAGDKVLLVGQPTASENRPFVWNGDAVAMTPAPDPTGTPNIAPGAAFLSSEGSYAGSFFHLVTPGPIVPGTTALSWGRRRAPDQAAAFAKSGTRYHIGDSMSSDVGASDSAHGLVALLAAAEGKTVGVDFIKIAEASRQATDNLKYISALPAPSVNTLTTRLNWANDATFAYNTVDTVAPATAPGSEGKKRIFAAADLATDLFYTTIEGVNRWSAQNAAVDKSHGTFVNFGAGTRWDGGQYSQTNGDYWLFTVPEGTDSIIVDMAIEETQQGNVQIDFDGAATFHDLTPPDTIDTPNFHTTVSNWPLKFTNLLRGKSRTLKIRVNSANGIKVGLNAIYCFDTTAPRAAGPAHIVAGPWRDLTSDNLYTTEQAADILANVQFCEAMGRRIAYVDAAPIMDPATDISPGDGLHPNDAGYVVLRDLFLAAERQLEIPMSEAFPRGVARNQFRFAGSRPSNGWTLVMQNGAPTWMRTTTMLSYGGISSSATSPVFYIDPFGSLGIGGAATDYLGTSGGGCFVNHQSSAVPTYNLLSTKALVASANQASINAGNLNNTHRAIGGILFNLDGTTAGTDYGGAVVLQAKLPDSTSVASWGVYSDKAFKPAAHNTHPVGAYTLAPSRVYAGTAVLVGGYSATIVSDWVSGGANAQVINTAYACLSVGSSAADGDGVRIGSLVFDYVTATSGYRSGSVIESISSGATATKRGSKLVFRTQADNTAGNAVRMTIDNGGNVLAGADNAQTMGGASNRWSTIYAGTGTINTSDAGEKDNIAEIEGALLDAAKELAADIRIWQFRDAIAAKGVDKARFHIGTTHQLVKATFERHGLDPYRFGMLCADPLVKMEKRTRKAKRQQSRIVKVPVEKRVIGQVDVPFLGTFDAAHIEIVMEDELQLAFIEYPLVNAAGQPVMHAEPVMEEFDEEYDTEVPDLDENGRQKIRLGIREAHLAALIAAGTRALMADMDQRLMKLEAKKR